MEKFNLQQLTNKTTKVFIGFAVTANVMAPMRSEAQAIHETSYPATVFSSAIEGKCIVTAAHAADGFIGKSLVEHDIYDYKSDSITNAKKVVGSKPFIRYLKNQDGAIICKSAKDYWKFIQNRDKIMSSKIDFISGIKKNPLAKLKSFAFPSLSGINEKGKKVEITLYTPISELKKLKDIKQNGYGVPVQDIGYADICYLNFKEGQFPKEPGQKLFDDSQMVLAKKSEYYKAKNTRYPIIYSLVKGRSGSLVTTLGFKSLGVLSSGIEDQRDQTASINIIKKNPAGRKAVTACKKLGFIDSNSQLGSISVFHSDSHFTTNPNPAVISKPIKP